MKELDLMMFLAVFQEMLGPLLWVLLLIAIGGTIAFFGLLFKEKKIVIRRLVYSEIVGLFGGILALVLMAKVSSSGFTDAGGPADWLLIGLVFGVGLAGTVVVVYTLAGWVSLKCKYCRR